MEKKVFTPRLFTEDERLLESPKPGEFRRTDTWRVFRIMSDFVKGFEELAGIGRGVAVFGSERIIPPDVIYEAAQETAALLVRSGFAVITGGRGGVMEAAARGALEAGGTSIGCLAETAAGGEPSLYLTRSLEFTYYFVRKTMLIKYSTAFVIFPGGIATLGELMDALTLVQTGKIRRFPVVLFGSSYWGGLLSWIRDVMLAEGKVSDADLDLIHLTDSPKEVVRIITQSQAEPGKVAPDASHDYFG